ncbi:MAG: PP2C family serine/threonine-protein phosphatase [Myxococcota bacterium]
MRKLSWAGLTDVGKKRTENEDAFVVDPALGLYVVCDGMGGHASGEVASAMTTEEVHAFFQARYDGDRSLPYQGEPGATAAELVVSNSIQHANDKVYIAGMRDSKLEGMGTTVVALTEAAEAEDKLILAHVGDSRIYRFRAGRLEQVTRDHSLLNHKIDLGELKTQEEIDTFKHGNVIVRAVGLKDYVRPETSIHERVPGDIYLLCSDGLSDMVDDWSIENVLEANQDDLEEAAAILVRMANDRGGKDNITAVLVRVDDEPEPEPIAEYDDDADPTYAKRRESTQPTFKAVDEADDDDATGQVPAFKSFDAEDDDKTAPHAPVFAWDDDDDPLPMAATKPTQRPTPPGPAPKAAPMDTRRRMQNTEELPSIIVDDDEPSVVINDRPLKPGR